MNTVTIIGNLTRNPELRYSEQGTAVANLTVAVSRRRQQNGKWTDQLDGYFDVVAFQGVAEHAGEGLHKGDRVLVAGRLRQESYTDRNGTRRQRQGWPNASPPVRGTSSPTSCRPVMTRSYCR